ncbi:exodeoxyribonuclease VII small subunit [Rubellicoccus peritrichatus]|uniref:Exodeoxyribonuclease 7 small subunit n=1 Tax=Rubellicoccus peritrichatus TaxID=3080537 RepID=A0AAQ3QT92_9BACT|nr:exodeoxyribonuclease VII small subunit [Puniceicoccus sp. CR14]WOO41071.1 exodeoxyribonuclease VII small subunit [Puniceicoccus sp. CR14]
MADEEPTAEETTFEDAIEQLEGLVDSMESGDVPLTDLVDKFEQGTKLLRHCQQKLGEAEQRVEILRKNEDSLALEPLTED